MNENITTTEQNYPVVTVVTDSETPITTYETSETTTCADCELSRIQHNTDGIFLMTSGIFFLLVIYFIGKFLGNFFSM